MLMYEYDSNGYLIRPIKNRTATEITNTFIFFIWTPLSSTFKTSIPYIRYRSPEKVNNKLPDEKIDYQLVPPHILRQNPVERAVRTSRNHFITGFCSTDPNFPIQCRCKLLNQAEMTLNMLRYLALTMNFCHTHKYTALSTLTQHH